MTKLQQDILKAVTQIMFSKNGPSGWERRTPLDETLDYTKEEVFRYEDEHYGSLIRIYTKIIDEQMYIGIDKTYDQSGPEELEETIQIGYVPLLEKEYYEFTLWKVVECVEHLIKVY